MTSNRPRTFSIESIDTTSYAIQSNFQLCSLSLALLMQNSKVVLTIIQSSCMTTQRISTRFSPSYIPCTCFSVHRIDLPSICNKSVDTVLHRTFQEQYTVDEWSSCLRFAHKWGFVVQRDLALKNLAFIAPPVDKIVLGRLCEEAKKWLVEAFISIVRRNEPPTVEEGRRLGVDDLVLIGQLRYRLNQFSTDADLEDVRRFVEACLEDTDKVMQVQRPRSQKLKPVYKF